MGVLLVQNEFNMNYANLPNWVQGPGFDVELSKQFAVGEGDL
jgi:hypothetical protein